MGFEHYKYSVKPSDTPRVELKDIVASGKAKEVAENAERERKSHLQHKARMETFKAWVYQQDYLTDDDRAEMIKASFKW